MNTLPRLLFVLVLVVVAVVIAATGGLLPPEVASHFGTNGLANGWMPRAGYLALVVALAVALPLLVACTSGLVPRMTRVARLVRHPEWWMAPERREATEAFLANHACALGMLLSLFVLGVHLLALQANTARPAVLPLGPFYALLGAFLALVAAWIATLMLRFRAPG